MQVNRALKRMKRMFLRSVTDLLKIGRSAVARLHVPLIGSGTVTRTSVTESTHEAVAGIVGACLSAMSAQSTAWR